MNQSYREEFRPTVLLRCDPDGLGISLVEKLLTNFCRIKIYSKEKEKWQKLTSHISQQRFLEITSAPTGRIDYFLFLDEALDKKVGDYEEAIELGRRLKSKNLFVLPYAVLEEKEEEFLKVKRFLKQKGGDFGQLFIGDAFGPRMNFEKDNLLSRVLSLAIEGKTLSFSSTEVFLYPILFSEIAGEITRALFSFGPFNEKVALLGQRISLNDFLLKVKKYLPFESTSSEKRDYRRREEDLEERKFLPSKLEIGIAETIQWLNKKEAKEEKPIFKKVTKLGLRTHKLGVKISQLKVKMKVVLLFLFFLFLLSPFLSFLLSGGSLYLAYQNLNQGKLENTQKYLHLSRLSLTLPENFFAFSSSLPLVGRVFNPFYETSLLMEKADGILERGIVIFKTSQELSSKIFGDEVYEIGDYSDKISLELEALYQESGFFLGEATTQDNYLSPLVKKITFQVNLASLREKILLAKEFSQTIPDLLGEGTPTSYLLLFQNNMELRPTGGFIGSFALINFDQGRLTGIDVSDVYTADGQLKGHVEPPAPIKDHLGEANWFLRDANWDADFPTSAEKIEWFLEKETDKSVSGVATIDLDVVKKALQVLGPISLNDFNEIITADNLYEKTQAEVQTNFFPGSTKKASFLTALSRELLNKVQEKGLKDPSALVKILGASLEEKHFLVSFHNKDAQKAVSTLMFDGGVLVPNCSGNCLADYFGLVEANLGVNKANYFLQRSLNLKAELALGKVEKRLEIDYKNSANPVLGLAGRYKNYLRVILPLTSSEISVKEVIGQSEEEIKFTEEDIRGRKEIGFLVEIAPSQEVKILVNWKNESQVDFSLPGEYRLYVRKQPGTGEDPISLNLKIPNKLKIQLTPKYSLTQDGFYEYNTTLSRDFFSRLSW